MNDKNKDVLKLLKSWGICDRYVSGVSIAASVDDLRTVKVNVEYCLPRGAGVKPNEDEKEEYKPKFKVGECIRFPLFNFYVEAVIVISPARTSSDVSYRIKKRHFFSVLDEVEIMPEQELINFYILHGGERQGVESPIGRVCCP